MKANGSAVSIAINTFHINTDGSGILEFSLLDTNGLELYSGNTSTTYAGLKASGFDLANLVPALQATLLSGLNATHT